MRTEFVDKSGARIIDAGFRCDVGLFTPIRRHWCDATADRFIVWDNGAMASCPDHEAAVRVFCKQVYGR